jgi:hypothetical protein
MNRIINYIFILILLVISGCQNKELELTLMETACKNFKIHTPSYNWITDTSCGGSLSGNLRISFKFDGDNDCIDKIIVNPKFYMADNSEIANVSHLESYLKSDLDIKLEDHIITIDYKFQFATLEQADAFNHIYLKFRTENDLGNKSKNLELRINGNCSTVDPKTYSVAQTISVDTAYAQVFLKDHGSEDGDIVSIFLNGKWVMENYTLTNAGETFVFPVNVGDNYLVLFAVNEGKVGPNTVSISINGTSIELNPDLLTGEAVNVKRF